METKTRDAEQIAAETLAVRFIDLMRTPGKTGRQICAIADFHKFWESSECPSTKTFAEYLAEIGKIYQDMYETGRSTPARFRFPETLAKDWLPEILHQGVRISFVFEALSGALREKLSRSAVIKHVRDSTERMELSDMLAKVK